MGLWGIRDKKERDVWGGDTMEGTNGLKECEESLVVGFGRVMREKAVSGSIRKLSVNLSKIIILIEDYSGTALVCREDQDVGIGPEGARAWHSGVLLEPEEMAVVAQQLGGRRLTLRMTLVSLEFSFLLLPQCGSRHAKQSPQHQQWEQ